ncbi:MAG: aldo/keto reductase [Clostridiales Family XIII bacterium]|jgi:aryl-alcohol dehydrogenase-like predicted oxidoreductase|nr:aldo/keto reductase [Clostridiales Family XIII bacterium]
MTTLTLGRTGLVINKDAFGALPLQRASRAEAALILDRALDAGINFIDTARAYTDSEEKIAEALAHRRSEYFIATKTMAKDSAAFWKDLNTSLRTLKTDCIDIYQIHNPSVIPRPEDGSGLYEALQMAQHQGKIRFIGVSNHRLDLAKEAAESGLYDTLQFPFSYLSDEKDTEAVRCCARNNVGFIAMKALSGGLLTDIFAARAYMSDFDNVAPIWGIQRAEELDLLIEAMRRPAELTDLQRARIEADRAELRGDFCRGCGYCAPCPADIQIFICARMSLMTGRMPLERVLSDEFRSLMEKTRDCIECGVCASKCPYGLNPPELLKRNYEAYKVFLSACDA